jgi:hypothetical protein
MNDAIRAVPYNTAVDTKYWLNFEEISTIALSNFQHQFCDTCIRVTFKCTCDKADCSYNAISSEKKTTICYYVWSGTLLRSAFFSNYINFLKYQKSGCLHAPTKQLSHKAYTLEFPDETCDQVHAFSYFFKFVSLIHKKEDIITTIQDIIQPIPRSGKSHFVEDDVKKIIANTQYINNLADKFGFPFIIHLCRILQVPIIYNNTTVLRRHIGSEKLDKYVHNIETYIKLCTTSPCHSISLSLNGAFIIQRSISKKSGKTFFDSANVTLKHCTDACLFCSMSSSRHHGNVNEFKLTSQLDESLMWNSVLADYFQTHANRHNFPTQNTNESIFCYRIPPFYTSIDWLYLGDFVGAKYSIYIGTQVVEENDKKVTSVRSLVYILRNVCSTPIRTVYSRDTVDPPILKLTVVYFANQFGCIRLPDIEFDISVLLRTDITDKFIINKTWTFANVGIPNQSENTDGCIIQKLVQKYHQIENAQEDKDCDRPLTPSQFMSCSSSTDDDDDNDPEILKSCPFEEDPKSLFVYISCTKQQV